MKEFKPIRTLQSTENLNNFIDRNETLYSITDEVLKEYGDNGMLATLADLDKIYKMMNGWLLKPKEQLYRLNKARSTLRAIGYNDYVETM